MGKYNFKYCAFNNVILRTPILPIRSVEEFESMRINPIFEEGLFFSSPRMAKLNALHNRDPESDLAILRYFLRSCTRATPFGLFSGLSNLRLSEKTDIVLERNNSCKLAVRLDMTVISSFIHLLLKDKYVCKKLKYCCNQSIYKIYDRLRFIDWSEKNFTRDYQLSSVEAESILIKIIHSTLEYRSFEKIIDILINYGYSKEESQDYLFELIDSKILLSELEITTTNTQCVDQILLLLENIPEAKSYCCEFKSIITYLKTYNNVGAKNRINQLNEIKERIKSMKIQFVHPFQCDMFKGTIEGKDSVGLPVVTEIQKVIQFLNKCPNNIENDSLKRFKEKFNRRYGDREMPLLLVLDEEVGIGYENNYLQRGNNPLIDDIILPESRSKNIKLGYVSQMLFMKIQKALKENKKEVRLSDSDLEVVDNFDHDLAPTFSVLCSILKKDNKPVVIIKAIGGSSATNLLSRFCYADKNLSNFVLKIIKEEELIGKGRINAEIVHIPNDRLVNISLRPDFREYEIPYLSKSNKDPNKQITLSDLLISIKNSKIFLRSKKHNLFVNPVLSTSHNYRINSLPIYKFLCDLQFQDIKHGLGINLSSLLSLLDYIPRIVYNNSILSLATWKIDGETIKWWNSIAENELIDNVRNWRKNKKMPSKGLLIQNENEFFVNFEEIKNLKCFLKLTKSQKFVCIQEFLFDAQGYTSIVKDTSNASYVNEFVFSFYKKRQSGGDP